jgi:hypothetical protein
LEAEALAGRKVEQLLLKAIPAMVEPAHDRRLVG